MWGWGGTRAKLGWPCPPHRATHLGAAGPAGCRRDQAFLYEGQGFETRQGGSLSVAKSKLRVIKRYPPPSRTCCPFQHFPKMWSHPGCLEPRYLKQRGAASLWPVVAAQAAGRFWRDWAGCQDMLGRPLPLFLADSPHPLWGTA